MDLLKPFRKVVKKIMDTSEDRQQDDEMMPLTNFGQQEHHQIIGEQEEIESDGKK